MKFLRYLQKKRRAMLAMAATLIFSSPFTAQASTITTKDGKTLTPQNNVYNIAVQKELSKQVGVNKFKDFTLDNGHIANMQFGTLQTLANLVDNKININGTVNALRDGKIGGNLYFISPNGIAVGATGVINAGVFTGMAVDKDYFNKLSKMDNANSLMTELAPSKIAYNNDPDKGIDIQGVINAPGGISLYATKINVGKDAVLRTDVSGVKFKDVVNIKDADGSIAVNSGITGGLDASYSGGDIVLKAHAEHIADDNMLTNIEKFIDSSSGTATRWEKITEREATVNVDGKIESAGGVSINAESNISFSEGSKWNVVTQSKILESIFGNLGFDVMANGVKKTNKATVNIGKTADVHSAGAMDIGASATLNITLSAQTPQLKTGMTKATQWVPAVAVAIVQANNKAEVNISGKLESDSVMMINSYAETEISSTAKASTQLESKNIQAQLEGGSSVPEDHNFIAVGVIDGETKADVNIKSGSKITVNGEDFDYTGYAEEDKDKEKPITKHMDALTIKATTINTVGSEVSADPSLTNVETASATAVSITNYKGTANVNIEDKTTSDKSKTGTKTKTKTENADINAKNGNAVIGASNTFINTGSTSTGIGADPATLKIFAKMPNTEFLETFSVNAAKRMFSGLQLAGDDLPEGDSTFSKIFKGELLKLGSAVSVFNQDNNAKVNVGKNASINAMKNVDISSSNKIAAQKLSTTATINNLVPDAQKNEAMVGIGVQVSNVKNNADTVIKGSVNSGAGSVSVDSYAGMNYNQVEALQTQFKTFFKTFAKRFRDTTTKDDNKKEDALSDVKRTFAKYESQITKELDNLSKAQEPEAYMTALKALNEKVADTKSTGFDAAVRALDKANEIKESFAGVIPTLTSFLHPANYTNYYVRSAFSENKTAGDISASELSAAGSFSINSMPNTSRIILAEDSAVTADNGAVNFNSKAENRIVAITGMGGEYGTSSKAANRGAGISVKVGNFTDNSIVAVGKNAQITASNINIDSKEYAKHANIIYGNGKADSLSVTGMVSYFNAPANNIISIDDSAKLDATKNTVAGLNNAVGLNTNSERYITTITGALTLGNGNGKSFGATINVLNNNVNNAVLLGDNGYGTRNAITGTSLEDKADAKILTLTNKTLDILGDYGKLLGSSSIDSTGEINANKLYLLSKKTGTLNSIAVAGTENSDTHGFIDGYNNYVKKGSEYLQLGEMALGMLPSLLSKYVGSKVDDKLNNSGQNNPKQALNDAEEQAGNENGNGDGGINLGIGNNNALQLNVAGAGSVAVNLNSGETGYFVSNYKLNVKQSDLTAKDDTFHGSWAGAGAFNFFGDSEAAENTNVAVGGSVALNQSTTNVDSVIKNSTIKSNYFSNVAEREDSDVAAGMGLAVSTNEEGTNVNIPISASINVLKGDTHSLMIKNNFTGVDEGSTAGGGVYNKSAIGSVQVAGGLALGVSKGEGNGFTIGGNAAVSQITNDLQSGIKGGSYENVRDTTITALKKSNQVDVAVAGGINSSKYAGGFAFGGAVAVSDINNTANAFLKDTTKFNANGLVQIDALESKNTFSSRLDYLLTRKISTDATEYLSNDDKNKIDTINGGGNIVNVAVGTGVSISKNLIDGNSSAGGLGVGYAGITNLMNVDVSNNQNITAKEFNANSTNKSNIVNVAVGIAGAKGNFSVAGSVGISDIKNDGTINIENSNITADSSLNGANSSAHIVNVAGRANGSDELAAGLTFAYNGMNNTTGINVKNGTWNVKDFGLNSSNNNYALAVGAGVAFSKEGSAINGAVGLNLGTNSTKSIADGLTMSGIKNAKVTATDNTSKTTVAGGLTISKEGTVALGGAIAYANIGKADNKEVINAKITNSKITAENDSTIDVEALDKAKMTTVAVGVGASGKDGALVTFQGAAAVSEVNKENVAEISNTDITEGAADVKIISTSGGNASDGLTISDKKIDVNNKVNTAAAVLDFNLDDDSFFDGALALSVNKFNQSTEANYKNNSRPSILSRVGNVNMFSNSEADILGVSIGGSGGKSLVSASGSGSHNYINNSSKTLAENVNVKADKNFGVVAQSDDKIANYAGAVNVDVDGYGSIGVSVANNEIKGNTDALVKNSAIEVGGSTAKDDLIAISNPQDNLIDGYVTRNTWTSGRLMSGRKSENKSGLVVNSSATHSISSDLATIGIRATSDSPGVGASGTVNINKIGGATNAKVEGTDVAGNSNSFVNAADYTNNGSFIGNAAVSGSVAVGLLWNENKIERDTNSLVNGGTLNVKNLDVKADSRQGLSNLNIAVGAGFVADSSQIFAAASGDNIVRNQLDGKTTAKIENATVNHSGNVDVNAYHKDNAYATNIAAGVAVDVGGHAGATFDLGYGLMRENSTVEAEINNSTLKSESGSVNVNAENNSKLAGAFGTAGIAVHVGDPKSPSATASVALGVNNSYITNTVHSGIKNSTLNVGAVDVNSKNTSEFKADGGVAAVSVNVSYFFLASLGAAVAVTNGTFDNDVKAVVDNSTINAAGNVNVNARDDHKSDETVVAAALSSGLGVSVNRMSTSINSGLADLKADALGKSLSDGDLVMKTDNASSENAHSDGDKLTGEFGSEKRFLNEDSIDVLIGGIRTNSKETTANIKDTLKKRYNATVNYNNSLKKGVFANVTNNSTIDAGNNKISIGSTENNDLSVVSGSGTGAAIGVGVGSTTIKARRANTANVIGSELKAKNIDISTTNGQNGEDGIKSRMYNATLTALGASVGYNNVDTNGTGEILISNSKMTADNLNAKATDNSKSKSYILDAGLKGAGYTGVFAYNTNVAQTGIEVSNKSALDVKNINFNAENHSYRATDTLAISASGVGVQTSTSEANDTSTNFINVKGAGNTFTADTLNFNALNGGQTYAHTNGQAYLGLNAVVAKGIANTGSTANIIVDDANTFATKTANLTAQIGEEGKYTAESTGFAINGSAIGINIDDMIAKTNSTANVNIGNEYFNADTTLNATSLNKASRNAFMRNNAYSLVANANDISAYTIARDKSFVTVGKEVNGTNNLTTNNLLTLNITADTENKTYVAAKGTGGSIGGDFGSAAHADNDIYNTSKATLNGTWKLGEDLNLTAGQHDSANISGYSARGAILTGGKGSLDNVMKGSSTATISEGADITARKVNINAKNYITTDKYSDEYDYTLFGRMGGVVDDVDYQRSSATTNKSANIDIGKNVTVSTTGTQIYDAANDYDLKNDVYADGGSLLVSLRWVKSHNYITTDENINVGKGATLKNEGGLYEDGGITFAAHDKLELNPTTKGFSKSGTGGYVRAETLMDLTRNQNVTIDGTLKSSKDLNLFAGADADGESSKVHAFAKAISQVQTLISDGSADIIRKGSTKSNVNINSGAYGQATHDINVISKAGSEIYEDFAFYGSTWSSDTKNKVATADNGNLTTASYTHNNKVKVDGELKAANTPDATVNISGIALPDGFILTNNNAQPLSYSVTSGDITITEKNTDFTGKSSEEIFAQQIFNGITTATTDYANDYLVNRYNEVLKLSSEYSGNLTAYTGLQQEKIALENEMIKIGMGSYTTRSDGTKEFIYGATPSIQIKTLVVPNIEVSGGNINVSTDNLTGGGKLNASGVPKIDIKNDSSAYLVTNRLFIADKGGTVSYNDVNVADNASINNLNVSKSGASFSDIKVAKADEIPTIKVSNNYAGQSSIPMKLDPNAKDYNALPANAKNASYRYTPINYIEVTKDIHNPVGKVIINNTQGSIRINSGANVNGMNIAMTAKESISQGYTEGIVNIAYTPEDAYATEAKALREKTGWDKKIPESDGKQTYGSNTLYTGGTGRIAGEAIYIAARDININGLIQSGFNGYKASITQKDIDNAKETAFFNGELMYKVNNGGEKLGKDGYYYYEPQVYYDKTNNKLYVEDINAAGGKIYLAGRILSTGNGKIVVTDGKSNVDITNTSAVDMNVGKITNLGDGFIQIVDSAQDKLTEYSSGQTRTIENYSDWLADNSKGKVTIDDGLSIGEFVTYRPQESLTYRWAEGMKQSIVHHYHKEEKRGRWGNADDPNYKGTYEEMANTYNELGKPEEVKDPLGTGTFIYNDSQTDNLKLYAQNTAKAWYGIDRSAAEYTTSGFFGYYHHHQHYWNKTVGTTQTYVYSLKADNPISVGIIGEKGTQSINLTNSLTRGVDLYLTGDIRNDNGAKLNISAKGGSIIQEGGVKISTDNINLSAQNDIKNIDLVNHRTDDLKLNAQTTDGNIDVNVNGGRNFAGNVTVNALNSQNGNVTLTAQGDIKQTINGTSVNAQNIKLESTNGAINLQIESNGQNGSEVSAISAAAKGNIKLVKNDNADFQIGSIVSTTGDVELQANGRFIDALDKVRDNVDIKENELVKAWIDMGLIAGNDNYKGTHVSQLEKDRDAYKADVTTQFNEYKLLTSDYQTMLENYNKIKDILVARTGTKEAPTRSDYLKLLVKKFSGYNTADEYLAADKKYQELVAAAKKQTYQWTEEELLSGIRSAIVNKQEGTASDVTKLKDANITARNVTLTGTGVGSNSKETTTIKMSELRVKANETAEEKSARRSKLNTLANVEAADVTVNYVLDANGKSITHAVEQVAYNYDNESGYYINKAGNYVRYRNDEDGNLMKYTYDKDLKQIGNAVAVAKDSSGNYDFSDVIKDTTTIDNKEIESFTISGTIPLGINATGNITVKTTGNDGTYIAGRNKGVKIDETLNPNNDVFSPLNINKIETSKTDGNLADVRIIGEAGIFNAADSGANVVAKDLILVGGNKAIGTQAKPFTVSLTGDLLDARANDEINLQKVGKDNFRISAMYSPKAIRITNDGNGIIEHSTRFDEIAAAYINTPGEITITGSAGTANNPMLIRPHETTVLNLKGDNEFYIKGLNTGAINLNDISGKVDISSEGSIKQTVNGKNSLNSITVAANGDVILDGSKNKFSAINIGVVGGNFALKNDSDKLTAKFDGTITGDATINQRGDIVLEGSVNGNVLSLTSARGNITSTGGFKATDEIKLNVGNFTHAGEIHTGKLTIATDNGVTINNTENTFSGLEISSRNGKAINGSVDVAIKADKFAPTIKNDVTGDVTLTNTKKGGSLSFGDGEAINISGNFTAKTNVGDFDYGSTLTAGKNISITAQNIFRRANTTGYFFAKGDTVLNAQNNIGTAENPIWISNTAEKSIGADIFGKKIYIKGVNDGILTFGDVIGTSLNASSDGSIAQADNTKLQLTDKLEVTATNDITLDNADNVIKAATINGGGNVKLNSIAPKGLTINGLKATGDVKITSDKSLTLDGELDSETVALTAGTDLTSNKSSVLKANKNIKLNADNVTLLGKVEMPYIPMTSDKVEDLEPFIETMPVIEVTTNKGLDMRNAANLIEGLYVNSNGEQINGSVLVTGNSDGFLAVIDKAVSNDITLKNTKSDGIIILLDKGTLNSTKGSITLDMGGDFGAGANIWATKDVSITSRNGSITVAKLSSLEKGEISQATSDKTDTLRATRNINLKAAKTIEVEGQVTAGRNIVAKSAGIDLFGKASMDAGNNIDLTVGEGNISVEGSVTANKGNVTITVDKGNLDIAGKLRANKGEIDIELEEGNIQIGKDTPDADTVTAKGNIAMITRKGIIDISGKTKSTSGSINIEAKKPAVDNNAPVASNDIDTDLAEVPTLNLYDITIDADIEANDSVFIVTDEGHIYITKSITVNNGDITIATEDGDIKINDNGSKDMLAAQNNLDIQTDNGAIIIAGKISTKDGDISITSSHDSYIVGQKGIVVEKTGAIKPGKNLYLNATNGDIEFKDISADNVDIKTINGDVTGSTIKADDTIHIALEHGDLYLDLARSKGVVIMANDTTDSYVDTVRTDSVDIDSSVTVGRILPYRIASTLRPNTTPVNLPTNSSSSSSAGSKSSYSSRFNSGVSSNFTRNGNSFATLGSTYTPSGLGLTYWQSATSTSDVLPNYSFDNFTSFADDMSYRLGRNYFEVRFVPTWLESDFFSIDIDDSFDNFGAKNATEDELTVD